MLNGRGDVVGWSSCGSPGWRSQWRGCCCPRTGVLAPCSGKALASALMSPSGARSSHVVRGVASGGPVCPPSSFVSYCGQSCSIRPTYVASVYGSMLRSARVQAWARSLYNAHCWYAGLGSWVTISSESFAYLAAFPWRTVCTTVYFWFSPPGRPVQVLLTRGCRGGSTCCDACIGWARGVVQGVWFDVRLRSVSTRLAAASSYAMGGWLSDSWMWSTASCACYASVSFIQPPVLGTCPFVTTPVGPCQRAFCMHRRILWAYARESGFPSAAMPAVICLCASSSVRYRLHMCRRRARAHVAN